jgi:hypothetical protein
MLIGLYLACPLTAAASDLTAGIYLQIPLGSGQPFYGFQASWQPPALGSNASANADTHRLGETPGGAVMEWRNHFDGRHELWMNGTRLVQTDSVYSDEGPAGSGTNSGVDGQTIAAIIVGAALVAAIANADSVKGCIGTACPSPEDPPDPGN